MGFPHRNEELSSDGGCGSGEGAPPRSLTSAALNLCPLPFCHKRSGGPEGRTGEPYRVPRLACGFGAGEGGGGGGREGRERAVKAANKG